MRVEQVPVDLTDENPAIFMSEPRGNRHEVNSRHDAERSKEVSQIVKPDPL